MATEEFKCKGISGKGQKEDWLRTDQPKERRSSGVSSRVCTKEEHYHKVPRRGHKTRADGVRLKGKNISTTV